MSARIPILNMTVGAFIVRVVLLLIVVLWTLPSFGLLVTSLRDKDQLLLTGWWTALQTITGNEQGRTGSAEDMEQREDGMYVITGNVFDEGSNKSIQTFGGGFLPARDDLRTVQEGTIAPQEAQPFPEDAEEPSAYVISGSFLDIDSELVVLNYGGGSLPDNAEATAEGDLPENITDYNANRPVELENGLTLRLDQDGNYEIRSDAPFTLDEELTVPYLVQPDSWLWYEPGETIEVNGTSFTIAEDGTYEWVSEEPFTLERGQRFFYVAEIPPRFTLENYEEVLQEAGIGQAFLNTFTVTVPATIIPIAIAAFASYAFAWMQFPGRRILFAVVVGLLVVPLQMSLIPLLRFYNNLSDLLPFFTAKSYPGIWLAHTGFGLPLAIYLMHNYISGLPREIIESAKIDGASHFLIFTRLVLPLSVPALASFAIFQFLWVWNDLLVALVFLSKNPDQIVLTSQIRELIGSRGDNWEILTSGAFVSMIVPLIVFFSLQRYFVRGLMAGSVKGG